MALINTTLCYIEKQNCYLMLHRVKKENDCNKDKWIGIGGKFENLESPEECVDREVKEETGLTLTHKEYRGIVTFVAFERDKPEPYYEFMHLFWSNSFEGQLISDCNEGDLQWIQKNKMNDLPHWKGDEIFLELLDKKVPFFSLKLIYQDGVLIKAVKDGKELKKYTI